MEGLGINLELLIAQIINFGLLFGLLYLFAYKPFLKMIDERSGKIKASIDQAEHLKQQAAETEREAHRQLEDAGKAGQNLIAQAVRTAEEIRLKARQEAQPEAESLLARARHDIQQERAEAMNELRKEFFNLTITAARKVIEQELDETRHRELIDKVLEESIVLKN